MSLLAPTPPERMVDAQGRPYFLWDSDMTLARFREVLRDPDERIRAYYVGKLMRQAKPDDVFEFVTLAEIGRLWPELERYLGRSRGFWTWLMGRQSGQLTDDEPKRTTDPPTQVDARHEILAEKLRVLLQRSRLRDLVDVKEQLDADGDLRRALAEAPRKESGFSPLILAYQLEHLSVATTAGADDWPPVRLAELDAFRRSLVSRLTEAAVPRYA